MKEKIITIIAFRMIPKSLAYWCAIRVWAAATTGEHGSEDATTITCHKALVRWFRSNNVRCHRSDRT